jgi:hypothetical protein
VTAQATWGRFAYDVIHDLREGRGTAVDDVTEPARTAVAASDQRFCGLVGIPELSRLIEK